MSDYYDYQEFVDFVTNLGIIESDFEEWLKTFLLQQAQRVVALAKQRQRAVGAIDTGFMINSWNIGKEAKLLRANKQGKYTAKSVSYDSAFAAKASIDDIEVVGDNLEVWIGNSAEYASFIEYGQRSYQGKYLLTISIDAVQAAIPQRFTTAFKKFLKDRGFG